MNTVATSTLYTVKEAAEIIGVTDARIRQLCIKHDLGRKFGATRVLTTEELNMLKATPRRKKDDSEK